MFKLNVSLIRNSFNKVKSPILVNKSKNVVEFKNFYKLKNHLRTNFNLNYSSKRCLTSINSSSNTSSLENYLISKSNEMPRMRASRTHVEICRLDLIRKYVERS